MTCSDCLIVQIHDHRSTSAPSSTASPSNTLNGQKISPFSVHNYNEHLTPSPYVAYSSASQKKVDGVLPGEKVKALASTERPKDTDHEKENALVASLVEGGQSKSLKQPKIYTTVLHPTPLSLHADITILASTPDPRFGDRRQSQHGYAVTPTSSVMPHTPTPLTASTPLTSTPPHKKQKTLLDDRSALQFESDYLICTTSPLYLKPAESAYDAQIVLDALKHPLHQSKPPPPKTRKRTVAELAADEALAAEEERFMLIMDERLSSISSTTTAGAKSASGDGQTSAASFETRFSRFKVLENIKIKHEEARKKEKAELAKRQQIEMERERRRTEEEKARKEQQLRTAQQVPQQPQPQQVQAVQNQPQQQQQQQQQPPPPPPPQQQQQQSQSQQQQPQSQQQQQQPQQQQQHAHPQRNSVPANSHPQHIQQVTQAQQSSPIVRQHTPHVSSPVIGVISNSGGGVPMNITTSNHGAGSPPRPPSAAQHPHPGVNATSHQMNTQRSQQGPSRNGTPQIAQATPNVQHATPVMHQATPRMSQASAAPAMVYTSAIPQHSVNALAPQIQHVDHQRALQAQRAMLMQNQQAQAQHPNHRSPQPTPQQMAAFHGQQHHSQQQFLQQQHLAAQQYQAQISRQQHQQQMQMNFSAQQHALNGMQIPIAQQQQQQRLAMAQQQRGLAQRQLMARIQQGQIQQGQVPQHILQMQRNYPAQQQQMMQMATGRGGSGIMGQMGGQGQGRGM
jgi:transcription factor SPT20